MFVLESENGHNEFFLVFTGVVCCYTNASILNRWLADNRRVKKERDSYLLDLFDL